MREGTHSSADRVCPLAQVLAHGYFTFSVTPELCHSRPTCSMSCAGCKGSGFRVHLQHLAHIALACLQALNVATRSFHRRMLRQHLHAWHMSYP